MTTNDDHNALSGMIRGDELASQSGCELPPAPEAAAGALTLEEYAKRVGGMVA